MREGPLRAVITVSAAGGVLHAFARMVRLLWRPRAEWQGIADQAPAAAQTWLRFALPLSVAGVLASVFGLAFVGPHSGGFSVKFMPWPALQVAAVGFALALASLWLLARWARWLAPHFGAHGDGPAAVAAVTHAAAPGFAWALLLAWPLLWWAWPLAAAWATLQLHWGLRALLRPARHRALPYTAAVLGGALLLLWLAMQLRSCTPQALVPEWPELSAWPWQSEAAPRPAGRTGTGATGAETAEQGAGRKRAPSPGQVAGAGAAITFDAAASGAAAALGEEPRRTGNEPLARTVLQDFLPAAPSGYERRVVESVAFRGQTGTAADTMGTTAYVRAEYAAKPGGGADDVIVEIRDLTRAHGSGIVVKLLEEVARTGGDGLATDGRSQRRVVVDEQLATVTVRGPAGRGARLEVIVSERYQIALRSERADLDTLHAWARQMNLAELQARAKAGKPVE